MEYHENYKRLYDYFKTFPGIGKRQAERFVYHILTRDQNWINSFLKEVEFSRKNIHECEDCFRIFKNSHTQEKLCERCRSNILDQGTIAVVEKNIDAENFIEKTNFLGRVFILGGVYPVIEKKTRPRVRLDELLKLVKKLCTSPLPLGEVGTAFSSSQGVGVKEIILCTSLTNDGMFTASVIKQKLKELFEQINSEAQTNLIKDIKITTLGRGFSTGTELEYADKETLLNALQNRSENII
jgi:recombination protein RecR